MENREVQEVILFPFAIKGGEKVMHESWSLSANGNYPAKDFKTLTFYSLTEDKIDRINCSSDEFDRMQWLDDTGTPVPMDMVSELYAKLSENRLPLCQFVFETKRNGRYSTNSLVEIHFVKNVKLDMKQSAK